jgi:hypothetical protein
VLNANQTINALHALFKIRHHGNTPEVLQVFVELSCHLDQRVRSEAVQLAVGLVEFTRSRERVPMGLLDDQAKALGTALGNGGLTPKAAHLVRKFLALERLEEMPIATKTIFFRCDHGHYFSGEACPGEQPSHGHGAPEKKCPRYPRKKKVLGGIGMSSSHSKAQNIRTKFGAIGVKTPNPSPGPKDVR